MFKKELGVKSGKQVICDIQVTENPCGLKYYALKGKILNKEMLLATWPGWRPWLRNGKGNEKAWNGKNKEIGGLGDILQPVNVMRKYEAETMFSDAINNCLLQQQLGREHNWE